MPQSSIREKLYDYIRVADEKKLAAIYSLLEDEVEEVTEWWKDKPFTDALNKEYQAWIAGKARSTSLKELDAQVDLRRAKRHAA